MRLNQPAVPSVGRVTGVGAAGGGGNRGILGRKDAGSSFNGSGVASAGPASFCGPACQWPTSLVGRLPQPVTTARTVHTAAMTDAALIRVRPRRRLILLTQTAQADRKVAAAQESNRNLTFPRADRQSTYD
ncbi:hypothetical protein GCM10010172_78580 [Paractinoplanes ferrugineus]|uniref:Uncharacterized protein n=1 Tax=Paractinoplanes ferrugineus TaxID=113564 RepID=A0A919MAT7_9ACTN|nr:hypothetical protein Afe05nite_47710 [Actinoplanes ferrugineus]